MEKTLTLIKEIMIAFVDIVKVFDNINWNIMIKVLRDGEVDYRYRTAILQPYKNQRALTCQDELQGDAIESC